MDPMKIEVHKSIINILDSYEGLHVNENIVTFLSSKYSSIPKETLQSIVGLWHQKKVASNSSKIRAIDIYNEYAKLVKEGERFACLYLAQKLDYPPALIAKIVLLGYQSQQKNRKTEKKIDEIKNLRNPLCAFCLNRKQMKKKPTVLKSPSESEEISLAKKHTDPRVELALNLFDEDDDVGKYFLEKFNYQERSSKNESFAAKIPDGSKANKFYRQASSFEEMGEKNVMKYKNIERLFSRQNSSGENLSQSAEKMGMKRRTLTSLLSGGTEIGDSFNSNIEEVAENCAPSLETNTKAETAEVRDVKIHETGSSDVQHCEESEEKGCECNGLNDSSDDSDSEDSDEAVENLSIREMLENTSLIDDPLLAYDVFICTLMDDQYGPTSDIIANSLGNTYERKLEDYVKDAGLPYKTEHKLRGVGVDKTPDIILLVPVAVDGFVINWIESKALFADKESHQGYKRDQFKKYINRFGPGLVIYWHGFVDEIPDLYLQNKQIIVRRTFPPKESFTFVNSDKFKLWMQSNNDTR